MGYVYDLVRCFVYSAVDNSRAAAAAKKRNGTRVVVCFRLLRFFEAS